MRQLRVVEVAIAHQDLLQFKGAFETIGFEHIRGGSGNLNSRYKWIFRATAA
jgi:hypothetical protein